MRGFLLWTKTFFKMQLVVLVFSSVHATYGAGQLDTSDAGQSGNDNVCGPRCVKAILEWYDLPSVPSLLLLIKEMQWPNIEEGATINEVCDALRARGVHTMPLLVDNPLELNWPEPVVLHAVAEKEGELGHFLLMLPSSERGQAFLWDGLSSNASRLNDARKYSGVVVLVSRHTITESSCKALLEPNRQTDALLLLVPVGTLAFFGARGILAYCKLSSYQ